MWLAILVALTLEPRDTQITRFVLSDSGAIVVPVLVDGQGPFRFLLDTGTSQSVVSERLARQFGTDAGRQTVMMTPAGNRTIRPMTKLGRVELGVLQATGVLMTVMEDEALSSQPRVQGVLGQDVLARIPYTIDYKQRSISWRNAFTPQSGVKLQLERRNGQLLALLPQPAGDGRALLMVPDSGSDALVLFSRAERPLPAMTRLDVGVLRTLSGQRLIRRVLLDVFQVGDLQLRDQVASLVPRTDPEALDGDGLLPLHIFSRVTFNSLAGYLVIER